jgi:predicted DsbA family dithiol-disulfide isomerase
VAFLSPNPGAAMTQPSQPLTIDVVSDVVCPWCYLGRGRLLAALASRPGVETVLRWRPFQLDPTIPPGGLDRKDYMRRKFGSLDRLSPVHERLEALGSDLGIRFAFDAIQRSPNTLDAHRLIRFAAAAGRQDELVAGLFAAYFSEGRDIGDPAVLRDVAVSACLDAAEVDALLAGDALAEDVRREIDMARELGIQGVPFFIFGGSHAVSGAEAPEVLASAIDQATGAAQGESQG